jgi:GntR family histidine utilization transcriptional repressor
MTSAAPAYQQIKAYVLNAIADGTWKSGEPISSEKQLAGQFAVARMTISRALWELSLEGVLNRVKGVGTFVAVPRCQSTRLEIRNIEDEIEQRGNRCFAKVLSLGFSDDAIALEEDCLRLRASKANTFHSRIVYYENALPVQYEDRFVHSDLFPDYLKQDFTRETPNQYMSRVRPVENTDCRVLTRKPTDAIRRQLKMATDEPCLLVWCRNWIGSDVASCAMLWHPASRFRLTSGFGQGSSGVRRNAVTTSQQGSPQRTARSGPEP